MPKASRGMWGPFSQEMFWLALLDFRVTAKNLTDFPKMVETGLDLAVSPDSN